MDNSVTNLVSEGVIVNKILWLKGVKVMVDRDIASLYGVQTRVLNQAVKRNMKRFPEDFMFQMTPEEFHYWKSQIVTSNSDKMSLRKLPFVFTEQGIAMLSGIIGSDVAISVSIQIIRVFVKLREILQFNSEILQRIEEIRRKELEQDQTIEQILDYLKQLEEARQVQECDKPRTMIGFKIHK